MSEYTKSPIKSLNSPQKSQNEKIFSEKEIKEIINNSFSKFNFRFQHLNDKYRIKMEDLSTFKFYFFYLFTKIKELKS